jgi:signal transduction histidine kinase
MERFEDLLWKNEVKINQSTAMICIWELAIIAAIYAMDVFGLFTVYSYATELYWKVGLVLLLCLPAVLVKLIGAKGRWVKYVIMSCSVLASGLSYVIFNAQALLLFAFPTALVTIFYNRALSFYTCALSVLVLLGSYLVASYLLLPPMFRNRYGFHYVIVDTAIPQAIYYLCFAVLAQVLNRQTLGVIRQFYDTSRKNEMLSLEKETAEFRGRMQERERISRDIHNSVGHTITAAIFALEAAKMQRPKEPEAADEKTDRAIARMRESMEIIRNSVRMMNDQNVMDVQELEKLLTLCCRQAEQDSDVYIDADLSALNSYAEMPMSSERISFLYGMVQECVTNGMKHGGARHFRMKAGVEEGAVTIEVWNDGNAPSDKPQEGFGLQHLRSYAEKAGGTFRINSADGFSVGISLPAENL